MNTTARGQAATARPSSASVIQPLLEVNWLLVLGLGAIALSRPAIHVVEFLTDTLVWSWIPMAITVVITTIWVAIVAIRDERRPFTTMLATGAMYAVLTAVLGGAGGALLMGGVQGPLADPASIPAIVLTNLVWGLVAGAAVTLVQRIRGRRIQVWSLPRPSTTGGEVVWQILVGLFGAVAGFVGGIVATDLLALVAGREALSGDVLRWVVASLVPAGVIVGLAVSFPLHAALRRAGDRRRLRAA